MNDELPAPESIVGSTASDPNEQILAEFLCAFDDHGEAAVSMFVSEFPHLADRIEHLAQVHAAACDCLTSDLPLLEPGKILGDFRVIRKIKHGGMGEIYLAEQQTLQRQVALKVIRPNQSMRSAKERFEREQQVLAKLHQSHIVPIYFGGHEESLQYFVMPYIGGATVRNVIRTAKDSETESNCVPSLAELAKRADETAPVVVRGDSTDALTARLPDDGKAGKDVSGSSSPESLSHRLTSPSREYFESVARFIAQVARSVHSAHSQGITHRDITPNNLMIEPTGKAWIIDFGLANDVGMSLSSGEGQAHMPHVSIGGGTPAYMSPEKHRLFADLSANGDHSTPSSEIDRRADIWGLGVTLYELLTLESAFTGSLAEVREQIVSAHSVPCPRSKRGSVPRELAAVCRKAIAKDAGRRYANAEALADDLRDWLAGKPVKVRPARALRRCWMWARREKWKAVSSSIAIIAIVAACGLAFASMHLRAKAAEREKALLEMPSNRLHPIEGWRTQNFALVTRLANQGGRDQILQKEAAASLAGLDVSKEKRLKIPRSSIVFNRAGHVVLAGGIDTRDTRAVLWTLDTDERPYTVPLGAGPVAFGPTDIPLQLLSRPGPSLVLWNISREMNVGSFDFSRLEDRSSPVRFDESSVVMAISDDGSVVAGCATELGEHRLPTGNSLTCIWNATTGTPEGSFDFRATALAVSPDNQLVAIGNEDGQVRVWDRQTKSVIAQLADSRMQVNCLRFALSMHRSAARGQSVMLAVGSRGGHITIWDVYGGRTICHCRGSIHDVFALDFNPDGTVLASGGRYNVKLWETRNGRLLLDVGDPRYHTISGLDFSPDGNRLAVASDHSRTGDVRIYELEYDRGIREYHGLSGAVTKPVFSKDGTLLAALDDNWQIAVYDLKAGRLLAILDVPKGRFTDNATLAFDPIGKRLAYAAWNHACVWDVENWTVVKEWPLPPGLLDRITFHPSGKLLLFRVETKGGIVPPLRSTPPEEHPRVCRVRDLLSDDWIAPIYEFFEFDKYVDHAATDRIGDHFIVYGGGSDDGEKRSVVALDPLNRQVAWSFDPQRSKSGSIIVDPTGQFASLATGDRYDTALLEVASGRFVRPILEGDRRQIPTALQPSARGWVRARGGGWECALFRRDTDQPLVILDIDGGHTYWERSFDTSGNLLAWGKDDGTVTVCNLRDIQKALAGYGLGW